jgi:phage gp16-like protein
MSDGSTGLIRAVQASRHKVAGLDDDGAWRDFLEATTGKRSLREMTGRELGQVLDALVKRGAQRPNGWRPTSHRPEVRKIYAIWGDMCRHRIPRQPTREGLVQLLKRELQKDAPEFLTPTEAARIIEALKSWRDRELRARRR